MLALLAASGRFLERAAAAAVGNLGGYGVDQEDDMSGVAAAAVSAVLGDDDLLQEILLRVGFPNSLVRASLVCKRWYVLASSPALLRRFRDLNPPRVLGVYVGLEKSHVGFHIERRRRLVLMPRSDELEAVVRRARSDLELDIFYDVIGCWNGCILTEQCFSTRSTLRWPLHPARAGLQPPPLPEKPSTSYLNDIFPGGDDCGQLFNLHLWMDGDQTVADVYKLSEDGVWIMYISVATGGFEFEPYMSAVLVGTKICMLSIIDLTTKIPMLLLLDLSSASFSLVELPEEVEGVDSFSQLSRVDDSLFLILVKGLRVSIWTLQMDGDNSWSLLNSTSFCGMCRGLAEEESHVELCRNGVIAEFVHLCIGPAVYLLDCKRMTLEKGYDLGKNAKLNYLVPLYSLCCKQRM